MTEQSMDALKTANAVRLQRAADKRAIKDGELSVIELLFDLPSYWQRASIFDLLRAIHGIDRHRALTWLNAERINPAAQVGKLTDRQRHALANAIQVFNGTGRLT